MPAVRVSMVELDEEKAEFRADIVPTPGMRLAGWTDRSIEFGAAWGYLHITEEEISGLYSGWRLIIRPDLVAHIIENAPALSDFQLVDFIGMTVDKAQQDRGEH